MKIIRLSAIIGIALFLFSCGIAENGLNAINSDSFPERNVALDGLVSQRLLADSVVNISEQNPLESKLDEMISVAEKLRKNQSDSIWTALSASWDDFRVNHVGKDGLPVLSADSMSNSEAIAVAGKWAELNTMLLKLSGEVRFGDAIENLLYKTRVPVLTEKQMKSIIYTHIDDQIFINVIGSSSVNHHHTTGGTIRLIQVTDFPTSNETTIKCECNDVHFLDVFIRIPSWAVNPTVTHGNVKYVAHPGEYCEISRKWNNGDKINVRLKN